MSSRLEIHNESMKRVSAIKFGEEITNICAGESNPQLHSYFVEIKIKSHKNKSSITHRQYFAKCTDRKGKFWLTNIKVIYPGNLSREKCKELFAPVWESEYGELDQSRKYIEVDSE